MGGALDEEVPPPHPAAARAWVARRWPRWRSEWVSGNRREWAAVLLPAAAAPGGEREQQRQQAAVPSSSAGAARAAEDVWRRTLAATCPQGAPEGEKRGTAGP